MPRAIHRSLLLAFAEFGSRPQVAGGASKAVPVPSQQRASTEQAAGEDLSEAGSSTEAAT